MLEMKEQIKHKIGMNNKGWKNYSEPRHASQQNENIFAME